jgi:hypothetical protein
VRRLDILLLTIVLLLPMYGCSGRLSPGTEGMVNRPTISHSPTFFTLTEGTKVRVVADQDDDPERIIRIMVLEGEHKGEAGEIPFSAFTKF